MSPDDQKRVVLDFLARCRAWGTDREIPNLLARLGSSATPGDAAKLHQWTTWVAFIDHATREVEGGDLDHWFRPPRLGYPDDDGADEPR